MAKYGKDDKEHRITFAGELALMHFGHHAATLLRNMG